MSANTTEQPITETERIFVGMVIHHLNSVYHAMNDRLVVKMEGMRRDIAQFLSLTDGDPAGARHAHSLLTKVATHRFVRWVKCEEGKQPTDLTGEQLKSCLAM